MNKLILTIVLLLTGVNILQAQLVQEWVERFAGTSGYKETAGIVVDNAGNVYVAGFNPTFNGTDMVTVKYNPHGDLDWVRTYNNNIEDKTADIVIDSKGFIYVTGKSENNTGTFDIATIKYNSAGDSVWVRRYNGPYMFGSDVPFAMCIDGDDNIYITGESMNSQAQLNFFVIKYNENGDSLWTARSSAGTRAQDVFTDVQGNVYIAGQTKLLKYNSGGALQWTKTFQMTFSISKNIMTGDSAGNLYIVSKNLGPEPGTNYISMKLNINGDVLWTNEYDCQGLGRRDEPHDVMLDGRGNLYITGESCSQTGCMISTVKYSTDGALQWERIHDNNGSSTSGGNRLRIDNAGNVYVTGSMIGYITIKYSPDGDSLWTHRYSTNPQYIHVASDMTTDDAGNLYITGRSYNGSGADCSFATIKFSLLTGITQLSGVLAEGYRLYQNYPNPFNPVSNLGFGISDFGFVSLKVYDVLGNEVNTLVNERKSPGEYEVQFDGTGFASGIYFYKLEINGKVTDTKKMILTK